jgi:hypothetical protein
MGLFLHSFEPRDCNGCYMNEFGSEVGTVDVEGGTFAFEHGAAYLAKLFSEYRQPFGIGYVGTCAGVRETPCCLEFLLSLALKVD